jgi:hypothetical protein
MAGHKVGRDILDDNLTRIYHTGLRIRNPDAKTHAVSTLKDPFEMMISECAWSYLFNLSLSFFQDEIEVHVFVELIGLLLDY